MIIGALIVCWLVPLIIITALNIHYLNGDGFENKISKQLEQLKFSDQSSIQRLARVIEDSRGASYDGTLLEHYELYKQGKLTQDDLLIKSSYYVNDQYSMDDRICMGILWYKENPEEMSCSAYNTGRGATYKNVQEYWEKDHYEIQKLSENLDTKSAFYSNGNRLYMIRNLYTADYENAATLVFLVNKEHCLQNYSAFPEHTSVTLIIDGHKVQVSGDPVTKEETGMTEMGGRSGYVWDHNILHLYHEVSFEGHSFVSLVRYDAGEGFSVFYGYHVFFVSMVACLLILIFILLFILRKYVTNPIRLMMKGAKEIEEGNIGYQLEEEQESKEFNYLEDSFNSMSKTLKHQIDHIYKEELALKDARINALQSHINPHFMNNTLEIINWEARLSGNEKVSKMIESLSILMDAAMDRKRQKEIPLSEEMVSVNAYLYIISERLGSRLTVINELPEEIMDYFVPRLILQPIIENAIEHGVVKNGTGTVILYGYCKEEYLYLEIVSESVLTDKDKDKIRRLLENNFDPSKEPSESLGIANVNQRLRIIYGEPCGLSIEQIDDQRVCARLQIRLKGQEK